MSRSRSKEHKKSYVYLVSADAVMLILLQAVSVSPASESSTGGLSFPTSFPPQHHRPFPSLAHVTTPPPASVAGTRGIDDLRRAVPSVNNQKKPKNPK